MLYRDVWVDRPQGLLLVYRAYAALGGSAHLLRLIAIVFGMVAVVAVATAVRAVATPAAGVAAAVVVAVVSSAPMLEGYVANGELLGGALSAAGVAIACVTIVQRRSAWWMAAAGAVGALGFSIKQSSLDGLLAVAAWLLVALLAEWVPRRRAAVLLGHLAGGALAVFLLSVVHGALSDWSGYWYALVGYRAEGRSVLTGAKWNRLVITAHRGAVVFVPVVAIALTMFVITMRRRRRPVEPARWMLPMWFVTAVLGFLVGGQFFQHYWVTLTFPVAALAGVAFGRVEPARVRAVVLAVALAPALVSFATVAVHNQDDIPAVVTGDTRSIRVEKVGDWLRHQLQPGDTAYALCAAAHFYAYADTDPVYAYLWFDGVNRARDAQARLDDLFGGDHPPTWVAQFDRTSSCDRTDVVERALEQRYEVVNRVAGVRIYHLRP